MLFFVNLQPFQLEVGTYQPTIEDLNKVGNGLDVLLRELQAPLSTKPHYRSNQLSSTMTKEEMERREIQDRMDKSITQPEAPGSFLNTFGLKGSEYFL